MRIFRNKSGFLFFIFIPVLYLLSTACSEQKNPYGLQSAEADRLILKALEDSLFAGAVLLAACDGEIIHHRPYGYAALYDRYGEELESPEAMTTGHLFDLASLTKIFATTYGIMHLHSEGLLNIDDPVADYLPEFDSEEKRGITIRYLLGHKSGMAQWHPTYYNAADKAERRKFIAEKPLRWPIDSERRYSDLGFMVLGDIIETVTGTDLEQYLNDQIYSPLGLEKTGFNPGRMDFPDIVSTSHGNPFEKKMVLDDNFGFRVDVDPELWDGWREYVLRGEVNDGNSFHTHSGIAGHAGLFSTAEEILTLLQPVLHPGEEGIPNLFSQGTLELFLTPDRFGHGLGWMMTSSALHGNSLPAGSFGHTGFTGTNFVVVPENELVVIFLTNRQHFDVDTEGNYPDLRKIREAITDTFY